jgi:hypothetical protein
MTLTENTDYFRPAAGACKKNYARLHSVVYKKFLFAVRELGLQAFTTFTGSSGTSIPVTSGAATRPTDDSVLVRKLQRTSFELYGSATETHTLFQQAYCITLYSIHELLKLKGDPRLHSTAPSDQKSSRVRTVGFTAPHLLIRRAVVYGQARLGLNSGRGQTEVSYGSEFLLAARVNCGRELLVISCI